MAFFRTCRPSLLLACACAVAGVAGCGGGPSTGEVSGTIKIRGQAPKLKGLAIGFIGADGRLVTAPINADGTYKAAEVSVGEVKVSFIYTPPNLTPPTKQGKGRLPQPGQGAPQPMVPATDQTTNPIPFHLREGSTSNLSFKVVAGQANVFDYDVRPLELGR